MKNGWWILILFITFLYGCPLTFFQNDELTDEDKELVAQSDSILSMQDQILQAIEQTLSQMDTIAAKQAIIQDFQNDPAILSIVETYEGLSITYKNGKKGVITLRTSKSEEGFQSEDVLQVRSLYDVPPTKKALYLITADSDINGSGEKLAVAAKVQLTKPGFAFEIARGPNFNLEKLRNLEGYGIIHIWAHGALFNGDVNEPYLCTDDEIDPALYVSKLITNKDAWIDGQLGYNTQTVNGQTKHRFFVFPEYIYKNNDFSADSTMIYGGFCYSALGNWKKIFSEAKALTYLGYDWVIGSGTDEGWMTDMYVKMCDTTRQDPYTLPKWFSDTNPVYKSKKNPNPKNNGYTYTHLWGHLTNAAFWVPKEKTTILRIDVDLYLEDAEFRFVVDGSETYGNGAHRAFVSSREGTSSHVGSTYTTTFNRSWFGTDYTGSMTLNFRGDGKVNVNITQHRKTGSCNSTYEIIKYDLPYSSSEGAYYQSGISAHQALVTSFHKQCTATYEELYSYNTHANDYFKVDVVYR